MGKGQEEREWEHLGAEDQFDVEVRLFVLRQNGGFEPLGDKMGHEMEQNGE